MPAARTFHERWQRRRASDRTSACFLARVKRRLATPAPPNPAHPMPPMPATVPEVESHLLDPHDLPGSFERAANAVSAEVHRINGNRVPPELVAELVERYGVKRAVISAEPEAAAVADELRALAVEVEPLSIEAAARADLGVTSASYGARDHGHGRAGVRRRRRAHGEPAAARAPLCAACEPARALDERGAARGSATRGACRPTSCSSPGRAGRATSSRSSRSACTGPPHCTSSLLEGSG